MTTRFIDAFRTLGFRKETVPGTPLGITAVDTFIRWYNIKCSVDIEEYKRQIANGDWANVESVSGKQKVSITASCDLDPGVGVADPPKWMEVLEVCGFKRNNFTITGTNYKDNPQYGNVTGTFWYQELEEGVLPRGVGIQVSGAMGSVKFVQDDLGKPVRMDCEFMGYLGTIVDIDNADILNPITTDFDDALPEAQLGITFTIDGDEIQLSKWEIDTQAQIELESDLTNGSGFKVAHMVAMNPTLKTDPYLHLLITGGDAQDWSTRWTQNQVLPLVISIGSLLVISAPEIQVVKAYTHADRGRMITNPLEFIFVKDSTLNALGYGLKILHGSEV